MKCSTFGWVDELDHPKMFTAFSWSHFMLGYMSPLIIKIISKGKINEPWIFIISLTLHTIHEIKDFFFTYKWYDFKKNPKNKKMVKILDSIWKRSSQISDPASFKNGKQIHNLDNTVYNSIGDTLAFILGYYIFLKYRILSLGQSLIFLIIFQSLLLYVRGD